MVKKYKSLTGKQYTFPVTTKEKRVFVEFSGPRNEFVTDDEDVQKALEESPKFLNKEIGLITKIDNTLYAADIPSKKLVDEYAPATFEDVVDINGAIDILKGEPYKAKASSLKTPGKVREQAEAFNVFFPNWV